VGRWLHELRLELVRLELMRPELLGILLMHERLGLLLLQILRLWVLLG